MTVPGPPEVARDVARALERRGLRARRVELVSPLGERKGIRFAYRVDTADGRTVKLRHFGGAAQARAHLALRAGLEEAFAPALGRCGAVVFEEWIEGRAPTAREAESLAGAAGELLGRLHARPLGSHHPDAEDTGRWRAGAESDVEVLLAAGGLRAVEAGALRAELARRDPGSARAALLHKDFCAENLLLDSAGRLRVIDNEQLEVGPAGFDLGRTFHRWPMSAAAWEEFARGYRAAAPAEPGAAGFWRLVAALVGARVFLQRMPARLDASLALVRRLLAEGDLDAAGGA